MGILRISFHRGTLKSYIRFFPNLEFLYKTAGDPGGREEQGSLRRDGSYSSNHVPVVDHPQSNGSYSSKQVPYAVDHLQYQW